MKKLLVWTLLLVLMLNLCACTGAGSGSGFQAGYATVKITPEESVPLAGYGNTSTRMSTNVLSDLYATCLALTDKNGETVLLIAMDLIRASDKIVKTARPKISAATGIAEDHIMITASHTHSAPDTDNACPAMSRYLKKLNMEWLPQVAKAAMDDRKEAKLSIGSTEAESLNFVRHYKNEMASGKVEYFGDNFGTKLVISSTQHATDVDETIHLVQFTREGAEPIVLANWRAHPTLTGHATKYDISADYVGEFRKNVEEAYGCKFIYFQGAAGNVNAFSEINSEMRTRDYALHGEYLAETAVTCLKNNMTQVEAGLIGVTQKKHQAQYYAVTSEMLTGAIAVQEIWSSTNDKNLATEAGKPYGIRSPYHANAIMSVARASVTAKGEDLELNAITIGNVIGFVTAPNELFDTNSAWLEENSPCQLTLTLGYANGNFGYIPSKEGFDYTCYESDVCKFKPGTGEEIQESFLQMLNSLAGK